MLRRASDRPHVVQTLIGIAIMASGIYLRLKQPGMSDWLVIALVGAGIWLTDRTFVRDVRTLVKQWFGRGAAPRA